LHRPRRLREPCEKCGSKKLQHLRFLIRRLGPDWKLIMEADKGRVH
jgi:hypothetical protein